MDSLPQNQKIAKMIQDFVKYPAFPKKFILTKNEGSPKNKAQPLSKPRFQKYFSAKEKSCRLPSLSHVLNNIFKIIDQQRMAGYA